MRLAIVAEADVVERSRGVRAIASQTSVSALGVGSWPELTSALQGLPIVSLIVYAPPLPGAPDDAIARLSALTHRLVVVSPDGSVSPQSIRGQAQVTVARPIADETLVLLARGAGTQSGAHQMSFPPLDFLQMICMSGEAATLVVSANGDDVGVIEVRQGHVWTAFDALGVGPDAFARLVRPEMRARVRVTSAPKVRTIFTQLSELALDSLRQIDEGTVAAPPPLSDAQLADALATPEQVAARIRDLTAEARRLLMDRSYDDAARVLVRLSELDPTSPVVRANLEQLRKLGYPR